MFEDEDIIMPDEDVEIPTTEAEGTTEAKEEVQTSTTPEQPKVEENEDTKILDYLNKKGIKYNGENVTVNSIDDLINTYQKGLNYDKVKAKSENDTDVVLNYVNEKAKALGITGSEYIKRVQDYEKQKEQEQMQKDINDMVSNGISEDIARRVAETEAARKELEKERAEYQRLKQEEENKRKEDAEYEDFIKTHPDIKVDEIPQDVFVQAKSIGLNAAYNQYENKILKDKLKQLEQAQSNASTSPVGLTSDGSSTEQESKDAFLEGFDSVL